MRYSIMNVFQRNFFILSCICISFILWKIWHNESYMYNTHIKNKDTMMHSLSNNSKHQKYVTLQNDVLSITINRYGGDIEKVTLLKYKNSLNSSTCYQLLHTEPNFIYQAQSGITGNDGPDNPTHKHRPLYYVKHNKFKLNKKNDKLSIPFYWIDKFGTQYIKIFTVEPGQYSIKINQIINNNTNKKLDLAIYGQFKQTISLPDILNKKNHFQTNSQNYRGIAYSSDNHKYEKYDLDSINNSNQLQLHTNTGWIAMVQQYFISAWVPKLPSTNIFYTMISPDHSLATIGYKSKLIHVLPHTSYDFESTLWLGPKISDAMSSLSPTLNLTIDYGIFWWLSHPLFKILRFFYNFIGNWGGAIIAITFLIKMIMFPLTKAQYISMLKIKLLQPQINLIKEKYKTDHSKISQEIILLYKNKKVNPLKGFFPLLIQMPIFLALYYMLNNSIELRHAPFVFWIRDLSDQDPYYILPILMGITMFIIQYISPNSIVDPLQKKIMYLTPVIFTIFFLWFPSGLVLYYIINNLMTIIQQQIIQNQIKNNNLRI